MTERRYFAKFSHEYPDGPSGPARSYWDVKYGTDASYTQVTTLCLHHRDQHNVQYFADCVCISLNDAREGGKKDKAREILAVLGAEPHK